VHVPTQASPGTHGAAPGSDGAEDEGTTRPKAPPADDDDWEAPPLALTPSQSLAVLSESPSRSWLEEAVSREARGPRPALSEATRGLQASWERAKAAQERAALETSSAVRIQAFARGGAGRKRSERLQQLFKQAEAKVIAEEAEAVKKLQAKTRGLITRKLSRSGNLRV
jgi:hypothetical protein